MELALLGAAAVVLIVGAAGLSRRLGVATPLLLVGVGAAMSYIPGAPEVPLEPEWILILVLPPLLYSAAVNVPLLDFRRNLAPIAGLGVVAVVLSAFVTGAVLYVLFPDLDFAAAVALGAVVGPPDAVAATSIAKRVGLPHRLVTVLEGESLINDASALVLLRTAIAAIGGTVSLGAAVGQFAWAAAGGLLVGVAFGLVSVWVRARFTDELLGTALSFIVPFLAYLSAERMGASGVIGVVVAGLLIGHMSARRFSARSRVTERLNWRTVQFVLENGVFLFMGYQLDIFVNDVLHEYGAEGLGRTLAIGLLLVVVLIVVRAAFVAPMLGVMRVLDTRALRRGSQPDEGRTPRFPGLRRRPEPTAAQLARRQRRHAADLVFLRREGLGWRGGAVIAMAGMRGVVTVAAAQSLPESVPYRSELILIAFTVAVVTLLVGGLTLPPMTRILGLRPARRDEVEAERAELLAELEAVTSESLRNPALVESDGFSPEVVEQVREECAELARRARGRFDAADDGSREQVQRLRALVLESQRGALLEARASGVYTSATIAAVEAMLDQLELRGGQSESH